MIPPDRADLLTAILAFKIRQSIGQRVFGLMDSYRAGGLAEFVAIDFVVLPNRSQLREVAQRAREGRLRTSIGAVAPLDDAVGASTRLDGSAGRQSFAFVRKRGAAVGHSRFVGPHTKEKA